MALALKDHPQLQTIVDGILAGRSTRDIAKSVTPRVSHNAVQRYRRAVVRPVVNGAASVANALAAVARGEVVENMPTKEEITNVALRADPYLSRIAWQRQVIDRQVANETDSKALAALLTVDLKGLELDARLTRRLDAPEGKTAVYVVANSVHFDAEKLPQVIDITADTPE